jgi:hypothetical protein
MLSDWHAFLQGIPPPRLMFGIGHSVVRTVKGVLVMGDHNMTSGQPSLSTHQVSPCVADPPE